MIEFSQLSLMSDEWPGTRVLSHHQSAIDQKLCHQQHFKRAAHMLGYSVNETWCWSGNQRHFILKSWMRSWNGVIAFQPSGFFWVIFSAFWQRLTEFLRRYWKYTWHEGGVPEFELSQDLKTAVDTFKREKLRGGYISLQWRMERTPVREANTILHLMINKTKEALEKYRVKHVLFSTDMSFKYGTKTLSTKEFETWSPVLKKLIQSVPKNLTFFDVKYLSS